MSERLQLPCDVRRFIKLCAPSYSAYEKDLPSFSMTELAAAYRLAKMWQFDQVCDYIYKHLDESVVDPFERLDYADELGFESWILPALAELCRRSEPLNAREGARLGHSRLAEVHRHREYGRREQDVSTYQAKINRTEVLVRGE